MSERENEIASLPMVDGCSPFNCANPECRKPIREGDRTLVWLKVYVKQTGRYESGAFCRECGAPPSTAVLVFIEHHYIKEGHISWLKIHPEDFEKGEYKEMNAEQKAQALAELAAGEAEVQSEKCRSCKAPVIWLKNSATGNMAPIDFAPSEKGNIEIDRSLDIYRVISLKAREGRSDLHTNHFATCPQSQAWKRGK